MSEIERPSPAPAAPVIAHADPERIVRAVAAAREKGDEAAFQVLYQTYYQAVRGFFGKRLAAGDLSLDLTQETFVRVHKGLAGYRGDAPFGAWLFRIARNVLNRHVSTKSVSEVVSKSISLDAPGAPDAAVAGLERAAPACATEAGAFARTLREERRKLLRDAIAKLPTQRRRCMVLWAYHELSYEQIATVMRLSLGTVKAHLAQAKEQLGQLIAAEPHRADRVASEVDDG